MGFGMSHIGCGVTYFSPMYGFKDSEKAIEESLYQSLRASGGKLEYNLVFFGDGVNHGNGAAFAEYITKNKLGEIQPSKVVTSPIHKEKEHNGYQMWFWYIDQEAVKAWYKEKGKKLEAPLKKAKEEEDAKARRHYYNGPY